MIQTSMKGTMVLQAPAYLLTQLYAYGKPCLCINIHHYTPMRTVLQQTAAEHAALHALCR